jgi:glycosyltransferase involved in cell wall biosynthesis/GT2 family glycosyltransferase
MTRERDRAYLKRPIGGTATLPTERPLAVLIVTDKSHDLVERCLASVAKQLPELPVFVYENSGARYPGRHELAARYPAAHWVLGPVPVGIGTAFNALVAHTPSDSDLLLLSPTAELRGALTRTRELLRRPAVAAVSPMACAWGEAAPPGPAAWDVAARRPTLLRALMAATGHSSSLRRTPISPRFRHQPVESRGVDGYLDGACLAISRAAWNSIGGFDEEFFGYGGDIDWQIRARAAGWRTLLADELGVARVDPVADFGALEVGTVPDGDFSTDERRRVADLLRANAALVLEHQNSVHHGDIYLFGTTLLDRLQPAKRAARQTARRSRGKNLPAIVIVTNRLVYGGAERQKALLAAELAHRGHSVTIVCAQRLGPLIEEIPHSVRVVRQPWWAPTVDLPLGPAVLISGDTNTETGFGTLWRAAGRDRRWLVAPHTPPDEDRPIYSRPLAAAMSRADGFIVLAQRHWDMLVAHHRLTGRHFVAPNGVTTEAQPSQRIRQDGAPVHLVMLSRIVEHKNPHLLVDALGDLTEFSWTLSIFGDGPDRAKLEDRTPTALRDRVHWRGWSPGPGHALAEADLLCLPSRSEAFPLVILEAMARAIPVAASAICAVPEMLEFGKAGFLVEQVTVQEWRNRLAEILADPTALPSVGLRGFERMRKHYTVEAMTDAYLDAIDAIR